MASMIGKFDKRAARSLLSLKTESRLYGTDSVGGSCWLSVTNKKQITTNTPENLIILQILIQTINKILTRPTDPQSSRGQVDSLVPRVPDAAPTTMQRRQRDTQAQSHPVPSEYLLILPHWHQSDISQQPPMPQ